MTLNRPLSTAAVVLAILLAGCANAPAADENQSSDNSASALTRQDARKLVRNYTVPLEENATEEQEQLQTLQERVARLSARIENLSNRVQTLETRLAKSTPTQATNSPTFNHVANKTRHNVTVWLDEAYPRSGGCQEAVGEQCWNVELNITNNRSQGLDISQRYWEVGINDTETRKDATASAGDEHLPSNTTKRLVLSFPVSTERIISDLYFEFQTVEGIKTVHVPVP